MSTLHFTLIQADLHWEDKTANLAMLEKKILDLAEKTEVVVLPEMFSTGFSMKPELLAETMEGETVQWMKRVAAEKRVILTGSVIIEDTSLMENEDRVSGTEEASGSEQTPDKNKQYYNRLIWMLPNGQYGYYDKRHLFAFAGEDQHYSAGGKRLIASVNGWKVNLQICYDLRFPVWARQQSQPVDISDEASGVVRAASPEYDVLLYVANWPERRSHAWKTLLMARAIENQCYVIGVNRVGNDGNGIYHSGDSMVIDPLGEILYHRSGQEDVFTAALDKGKLEEVRQKMPFWKDGDHFMLTV